MTYKTKETAIKHLRNGKSFSCKAFELFWEDADVFYEAVIHDKWADIPNCFSDDIKLALHACSHSPYAFYNFSPRVRKDRDVIITALKSSTRISYVLVDFNDEEMIAAYACNPYCSHEHLPSRVLSSVSHVAELVKHNHEAMQFVSYPIRDNEASMHFLIDINMRCFRYASERLRNSIEFVSPHCNKFPSLVQDFGNELLTNNDFMIHMMSLDKDIYNYLPLSMRSRKRLASLVADNPTTHKNIPYELLHDDAIVDLMAESTMDYEKFYCNLPDKQKMREHLLDRLLNAPKSNHGFMIPLFPFEFIDEINYSGQNWRECPSNKLVLYDIYKSSKLNKNLSENLKPKEIAIIKHKKI